MLHVWKFRSWKSLTDEFAATDAACFAILLSTWCLTKKRARSTHLQSTQSYTHVHTPTQTDRQTYALESDVIHEKCFKRSAEPPWPFRALNALHWGERARAEPDPCILSSYHAPLPEIPTEWKKVSRTLLFSGARLNQFYVVVRILRLESDCVSWTSFHVTYHVFFSSYQIRIDQTYKLRSWLLLIPLYFRWWMTLCGGNL